MTDGEWVLRGDALARIPCAKSLELIPILLPLRFDQMKRILSASCHKHANIAESGDRNNFRIEAASSLDSLACSLQAEDWMHYSTGELTPLVKAGPVHRAKGLPKPGQPWLSDALP
jgi:hypothetical protein